MGKSLITSSLILPWINDNQFLYVWCTQGKLDWWQGKWQIGCHRRRWLVWVNQFVNLWVVERHKISPVVLARARFSASVDDLEIIRCFLVFHEIKASPRHTQKPVKNFLVSAHAAQSKCENALNWQEELVGKNMPCPGLDLRYLSR